MVAGGGGGGSDFCPYTCPVCQMGVLERSYTCCGVLLAIVFFPVGILCCMYLRGRTCSVCGYSR